MELGFSSSGEHPITSLYVERISNLLASSPSYHYLNEFGGFVFNVKLATDTSFIRPNAAIIF